MEEVKRKVQARQEKLNIIRKQRRRKFLIAAIILVILVLGLIPLYMSGWFNVQKIEVVGNKHLTEKQVVKLSGLSKKTSLIGFPGGAAGDSIMKNPWVKEVDVSPSIIFRTVKINIIEREPLAAVLFKNPRDNKEYFFLVDKSGFVIEELDNIDKVKLPLIRDVTINQPVVKKKLSSDSFDNALRALSSLDPKLRASMTIVSAPSIDKLSLYTSEGTEILYGEATDSSKKNFVIKKILSEEGSTVIFIDIRAVSNPVVKRLGESP